MVDVQVYRRPLKLAQATTTRNCQLAGGDNGQIMATKQPFTENSPCVERGPTVGYNEEATTKAHAAVKELVTALLKP